MLKTLRYKSTEPQHLLLGSQCSVGGVAYGQGVTEIERAAARRAGAPLPPADAGPASDGALGTGGHRAKGFNFCDERLMGGAWQREARPALLREFFRVLAVCHTVIPDGVHSLHETHS